jgi:protein-tyrosine phosphatase
MTDADPDAGTPSRQDPFVDATSRILVVCTGNICRSPMAAALLGSLLGNSRAVESAGLAACVGEPADPMAIAVMADAGLDIRSHRARQLDESMLRTADLVLAMSTAQRTEVETRWPWTRGRVFRMGHWDGYDVHDPHGRPAAIFTLTLSLLDAASRSWADRLKAKSVLPANAGALS